MSKWKKKIWKEWVNIPHSWNKSRKDVKNILHFVLCSKTTKKEKNFITTQNKSFCTRREEKCTYNICNFARLSFSCLIFCFYLWEEVKNDFLLFSSKEWETFNIPFMYANNSWISKKKTKIHFTFSEIPHIMFEMKKFIFTLLFSEISNLTICNRTETWKKHCENNLK